jgi:hypothetical protein
MAWSYGDWNTSTYTDPSQARLDRLNLHIQEVAAFLQSPDMAAQGNSVNYRTQFEYYKLLQDMAKDLKKRVDASIDDPGQGYRVRVKFARQGK